MGYDLASGLHNLLRDEGDLTAASQTHGGTLHDVRVPSVGYPIANGVKRTGKRCLAVGTDCSVGKMYTAMAMERDMVGARHEGHLPRHWPDWYSDHRAWRAAGRGDRRFHGRIGGISDTGQRGRSLGPDRGAGQPVSRVAIPG